MRQVFQKKVAVRALTWALAAAMFLISTWRWLSLIDSAEPSVEPRRGRTSTRVLARVTLPEQAAFEDYRATLERPLFHPSRRPFPDRKALALEAAKAKLAVPSPTPAVPPPAPPQGFLLRGTVIAGPLQSAIFERSGKDGYLQVREGEQLEGWTLVEITRQNVMLRLGDRTVTWPLAKENESRQRRP